MPLYGKSCAFIDYVTLSIITNYDVLCVPYITWNYAAWSVSALNKTVTDPMIKYKAQYIFVMCEFISKKISRTHIGQWFVS